MHEVFAEAPPGDSAEGLLERLEEGVADVVSTVGTTAVARSTGLDEATVEAAEAGGAAGLELRTVSEILATAEGAPDGESIREAVREELLLGMSSAMLTVDAVAADVEADLDPKEVQGKIEGRHPMTLAEYASIRHTVETAH